VDPNKGTPQAAFVKVSKRTIERAIKVGELDVMRAGTAPRITDDAVWKWLHRDSPCRLSSRPNKEEDRDH
jgi:excisionase family DNA binding protein